MDTILVRYDTRDGVATITLDSPTNRNALSTALLRQFRNYLADAVADPGVRIVVLSHTGPVFCSGADLRESREDGAPGAALSELPRVLEALWEAPKPVVARIGGPARAGGIGLIGAADLAFAADEATFAFTEVRLGVVPAVISATVLPRLGSRAAAELFLTGEVFTAQLAARIGLITESVPTDELDARVDRAVAALLAGAPGALSGTKELLRGGVPIGPELERLTAASVRYFTSEEGREGVAAFRDKRRPSWQAAREPGPTA